MNKSDAIDKENYIPGEPIFTGDIDIPGMTEENLRYHLKNLLTVEPYADLNREYTISLKRIFSVSECLCPRIQ